MGPVRVHAVSVGGAGGGGGLNLVDLAASLAAFVAQAGVVLAAVGAEPSPPALVRGALLLLLDAEPASGDPVLP